MKEETRENTDPETSHDGVPQDFPVVGIGASAGGLEPLKKFFSHVQKDSGMAYIVVIHMHPKQPSVLADILQRECTIPVDFIEDGVALRPGRVYVVTPNKEVSLYKGKIYLLDLIDRRTVLPIDFFFRSLAQERRQLAAAVILSGTGTDGTLGLKEIKDKEGIVLVQTVETAQYDGMPTSALETALVDKDISPEEMPELLKEYFAGDRKTDVLEKAPQKEEKNWLNKIFAILASKVGHDFSVYKRSTILRRIYRRMGLNHIEDHEKYIRFLRENPKETDKLFQELLIGVTHFFRDADSFKVLKSEVLPKLLEHAKDKSELRIWVPGCSTGEEAYSLAIILQELLEEREQRPRVQIFATDIDQRAITKAREGLYTLGISADVGKERLERFFVQEGDYYRIRKDIREKIVFSVQNVIKDPPFLRIHLLCCRNLLIYLEGEVQKQLLPLFHYTLQPEGVLILGSSESLGKFTNLFQTLNGKWKIFKRKEVPPSLRGMIKFPTGFSREEKSAEPAPPAGEEKKPDFKTLTRNAVLDLASPTSVLVDGKGAVIYIHGRTGKYLEPAIGEPSNNILDMAREGLRFELSSALRKAVDTGEKTVHTNVEVKTNGDWHRVDLTLHPMGSRKKLEGTYLVVFEEAHAVPAKTTGEQSSEAKDEEESSRHRKVRELEKELESTRESHQTTIEELESSNEELKSANEELQSSNEELQSTNEELESSKEELQSLNEELQTVNSELQSKVEELSAARDDMDNLLNGIEVATIFVDNKMKIKRFTKEATKLVKLIQSDVGRPIADMGTKLASTDLIEEIGGVLERLVPVEKEVQSTEERWYLMRILPYRTSENRIEGAVITFLDIDDQKGAQQELERLTREKEQERLLMRRVFDLNPDPLAVLDRDGRLILANTSFTELMGFSSKEVEGTDVFSLENEILTDTNLKEKLQKAIEAGEDFTTDSFTMEREEERREYRIAGQIVQNAEGEPYRILLVVEADDGPLI